MVVRAFFSEFWQTFIPSFEEMAAGLKKGLIIESAKSVAQSIAKYFSELIDRLKRCVKEKSLSPLWGETWDPTAWENEVRNFVLYYPLLTTTDGVPEDLKKRF